jgi:hypothetical protein
LTAPRFTLFSGSVNPPSSTSRASTATHAIACQRTATPVFTDNSAEELDRRFANTDLEDLEDLDDHDSQLS